MEIVTHERHSSSLVNNLRRAMWPWMQAHALKAMIHGMLCGSLVSITTVLVYLHGF